MVCHTGQKRARCAKRDLCRSIPTSKDAAKGAGKSCGENASKDSRPELSGPHGQALLERARYDGVLFYILTVRWHLKKAGRPKKTWWPLVREGYHGSKAAMFEDAGLELFDKVWKDNLPQIMFRAGRKRESKVPQVR